MRPDFAREPITVSIALVLEPTLADAPLTWKVDVARRPNGGGWQGDIKESAFEAYAVLTPLATGDLVTSAHTGGFGSGAMNALPYTITCVGVSAGQVERLADLTRKRLIDLAGSSPAGSNATIVSALPARIGACQRIDQDHGEYWVQTDLINVNVS